MQRQEQLLKHVSFSSKPNVARDASTINLLFAKKHRILFFAKSIEPRSTTVRKSVCLVPHVGKSLPALRFYRLDHRAPTGSSDRAIEFGIVFTPLKEKLVGDQSHKFVLMLGFAPGSSAPIGPELARII